MVDMGRNANTSSVSVVVPVYRSAKTLISLTERVRATCIDAGWNWELVFVDDQSPDDAWAVLQQLKATYPDHIQIVRLSRNSGQHAALLCGLGLIRYEYAVTIDDDLQHRPEDIPALLAPLEQESDLVIAAYHQKQHRRWRNWSGGLVDSTIRHCFRLPSKLQLTSFRAFRRELGDQAIAMHTALPYITCMLLTNARHVVNVPVHHEPRREGRSNYNLWKSVRLALLVLLNYSLWPLYAISALCGASLLIAIGYTLFVLINTLAYGVGVPGWASVVVLMSLFNGSVMLGMLVLGVYLAHLHLLLTVGSKSYGIQEHHGYSMTPEQRVSTSVQPAECDETVGAAL